MAAFVQRKGITPETADLVVTDQHLTHMLRETKVVAGKSVPEDMVRKMPEVLGKPDAVLWNKDKNNLTYVFDVPDDPRKGKFAVDVNFEFKYRPGGTGTKITQQINAVKTGGMVQKDALTDTNVYEVIKGKP